MSRIVIEKRPGKSSANMFIGRLHFRRCKQRNDEDEYWEWYRVWQWEHLREELSVDDCKLRNLLEQTYQSHKHKSVPNIPRFPRLDPTKGKTSSTLGSEPERNSPDEASKKPRERSDQVKRTKWGTRVYSNNGKHYFNVGVWKSRGYPACTTIRLSVAGRNCMYTLDERNMRALRAEISLRGHPKPAIQGHLQSGHAEGMDCGRKLGCGKAGSGAVL